MEKLNYNENSNEIIVSPEYVESAIRKAICEQYPELAEGWALNPKYNLGTIVFAGTKN